MDSYVSSDRKTLSVTRLVRRMRNLLEIEIGEIWVEGEISNLRRQSSGHCYFTLKDEGAQISCVLFRGVASKVRVQPEDGMQARIFAEVSVYETRGQVQLIVKKIEDAGLGDLQARFAALKQKLDSEGLFDPSLKIPLPKFPQTIGLITSPTGAALQDMLNILSRRAPWVQPILYPVAVQGKGAEIAIANAIEQLGDPEKYDLPRVDVIIIGRGGGSLEDLWNFNEEVVARAIHGCQLPVVSAIGHEIDFTIADFVADVRAPTPSAAAELVVPDAEELLIQIESVANRMQNAMKSRLRHDTAILASARRALLPSDAHRALRDPIQELDWIREQFKDAAESSLETLRSKIREISAVHAAHHPEQVIHQLEEKLVHTRWMLQHNEKVALQHATERLHNMTHLIRALGPETTLARGFSMTTDENGKIITDASGYGEGDRLVSQFARGELKSRVEK